MIRRCETCVHHDRDCDIVRCIEGGILTMWEPRTLFRDFPAAADYRDILQPDNFHAEREGAHVRVNYDGRDT